MSRLRHASRTSALIVSVSALVLQVLPATGQWRVAPQESQTSPGSGSRLAEAAQDPTLAPWQRDLMLEVARSGPVRAAAEPMPVLLLSALASAGSAPDDGTWSESFPAGNPPTRRFGHTAIYDPVRDRMVVFGGALGILRNDVWVLSLAGSPAWSELAPAGSPPPGSYFHTAIYDPVRDRMVVFGGQDSGGYLNGVWTLSLAGSPAWSELAPAGSWPPGRQLHTAIYDPVRDRMVVFGGFDGDSIRNDAWELSFAGSPAWSELATTGSSPPGRWGHTAIYDPVRDRMVVFGGGDWSGPGNDAWALSLAGSAVWSGLAPGGSLPHPRGRHTAIYDLVRDRMVVFGGSYRDHLYFSDGWALSLGESPAWSTLAPAGSPPASREFHTAIFDPLRDHMVVHGGVDAWSFFNDTWVLEWDSQSVPALVSLAYAEAEPDRVSIAWYGSGSAGLTASIERREAPTDWQGLATISADGTGMFQYEDRAVTPGARYAYRLVYLEGEGAETVTAETWVDVPTTVSFALEGLRPNPAGAELVAVFAIPDDAPAELGLIDIKGRQVLSREVGSLGAGRHTLRLAGPGQLPAGVYWLRLERMGLVRLAKTIILR